ncbi:hypothetical protein B0T10DRAFT_569691 [Thelonectria olida]|uniref:Uncharacterized protein n=1 Tax=Thelonectria olida TaxID=1576542 RepID=A0A9P8VM21_9HYPO|nr:hypothetical protein B0T10DRAFT_569691 [Thelonectria olida]
MRATNNTIRNDRGESVEITRAILTDESEHDSTAFSDPNVIYGPHWTIQLTNDELEANDFTTHLLHFRPQLIHRALKIIEDLMITEVIHRAQASMVPAQ